MNYLEKALDNWQDKKVWFYLEDECTKQKFKEELVKLKAKWMDGNLFNEKDNVSCFMAVHFDKTIGFVSGFVWKLSFVSSNQDIIHINYKNMIMEKACIMHESGIVYIVDRV